MNKFNGFESPKQNWSKLPHQMIDALPQIKTLGEMKIILYTLRHTWGYRDDYKKITLDEFQHGRKKKDGSRIDNGTGLTKPTIVDGIKRAIKNGFLFEHVDTSDSARVKKFYSLTEEGLKDLTPGVKKFNTWGKDSLHRTEKETLERNLRDITLEKKSSVGNLKDSKTQVSALDLSPPTGVQYKESNTSHTPQKPNVSETDTKDEFTGMFGKNPRQDEIDTYEGTKLTPDELLLASMGAGVSSEIRSQIALMRDSGWNIRDSEVESLMAQFFVTTGFVMPTDKGQRNFFVSEIRNHKSNELFSGRVPELYQLVWDKVSEDYNSGDLELTSPKSFTQMMHGVINREQVDEPFRTTDQMIDVLQREGLVELGEVEPGKWGRVWVDTKKLVETIPEDILEQFSLL